MQNQHDNPQSHNSDGKMDEEFPVRRHGLRPLSVLFAHQIGPLSIQCSVGITCCVSARKIAPFKEVSTSSSWFSLLRCRAATMPRGLLSGQTCLAIGKYKSSSCARPVCTSVSLHSTITTRLFPTISKSIWQCPGPFKSVNSNHWPCSARGIAAARAFSYRKPAAFAPFGRPFGKCAGRKHIAA